MRLKNRIIISILLALTFFSASSFGYDKYWAIDYQISFPVFDHADFIEEPSFLGWSFQFSQEVTDILYLGAYFGWSRFYEDLGEKTYSQPGQDKTVHIWRQSGYFPTLFQPTVLLMPDSPIRPLASLGIGAYFTHKENLEGFWDNIASGVNFGLRPELGIQLELDRVGFKITGAFNGIFGNPGYVEGIQALSVNAGFIIGM
jgi:hypothetical protein